MLKVSFKNDFRKVQTFNDKVTLVNFWKSYNGFSRAFSQIH